MQPRYLPATTEDSVGWQQTVMAFLAEKERRSGSRRTVEGYARMLWQLEGARPWACEVLSRNPRRERAGTRSYSARRRHRPARRCRWPTRCSR